LKLFFYELVSSVEVSLPTRGAWIETLPILIEITHGVVAPHSGGVD